MTLALILDLPTATGTTYAFEPDVRLAALERGHLIQVIPLAGQIAPSPVVESDESEPTWEDAAWQ